MSGDLSGFSMFELFKVEAETHAATLNEGLLAIESNPEDLSQVEKLMRAAHSVKGAARIIGMDSVVELAHVMEDCFVAVQNGNEELSSARVDQLLSGVDFFQELARISEAQLDQWLESRAAPLQQLTNALGRPAEAASGAQTASDEAPPTVEPGESAGETGPPVASAGDAAEVAAAQPPAAAKVPPAAAAADQARSPANSAAPSSETKPDSSDIRTVTVDANNLNRIMRLASESMVDSRRLQSMQQSLTSLLQAQRQMSDVLEKLDVPAVHGGGSADSLDGLRTLNRQSAELLQEHSARLERALWRSERTSTALYHQVIGSRMRPFAEGTRAFPRMIRDLSRSLGKQVALEVLGGSVAVDRDILRKLEAPLNHVLRNCVDHGIEDPDQRQAGGKPAKGNVVMEVRHHAGMLTIEVRDDGRGIDAEDLRSRIVERKMANASLAADLSDVELFEFLFLPGFSTAGQVTEVSGRGVGLDVVQTMVQEVSGTVRVDSVPGEGTTFTLRLPVTLSVVRAALAEIAGEVYAFPLAKLVRIVRVPVEEIRPVQGRQQFQLDGHSVGLVRATEVLDLPGSGSDDETISVVVIGQDQQPCGIAVDCFIGEQDLVVRPLDPRLGKVPHVSAAAVTEAGEPLLIVDTDDLLHSIMQLLGEGRLRGMTSRVGREVKHKLRVLVVDDSITVREVERQLLTNHGFHVDVAVDGQDGWHALRAGEYDLLVTDVDMPRMNGIELIQTLRRNPHYEQLPVIIVSYKEREEDRLRGFEAGANAYLTKGSFHDDSFVKTVNDLIGAVD